VSEFATFYREVPPSSFFLFLSGLISAVKAWMLIEDQFPSSPCGF